MLNPYIFREYDIRGKVDEDFPHDIVVKLGKAFGTFISRQGSKELGLSGDVRLTTPNLIQSFKKGVLSTGTDVINLGIAPTPVNYYSMFKLGIGAAVQITGSHNPPEYNGFKMSQNRKPVFGKDIQTLYQLMKNNDFEIGEGTETRYNILDNYKKMILENIKISKPMNIVMDCGNAAGAINAPIIFKELGVNVKELFCDVDGTFPNHHPDPTIEQNLRYLIDEMKNGKYDCGIAFDGDADRIGVVDENGKVIWADQLMAIFLPDIIEEGDDILFDVKCSQALEEMIVKYGGNPVMWKTGHSLIKQKMTELGSKLGGEMSGHIFFSDRYYGYDDGIYVAARLVELLSNTEKTLSQLKAKIPLYYSTPEIRLAIENDEKKFKMTEKAVNYFSKNYDCSTIDGVRIQFDDGWGLIRSSNTQPVIVCRFEANSEKRRDQIKKIVLDKLNKFGEYKIDNHI